MPIIKQKAWDDYVKNNQDDYGKCCVDIARRIMEILDDEDKPITSGHDDPTSPSQLITRAEKDIGERGVTGFMAGCIANIVSKLHSRGDEFRQKWNEDYGVKETKAEGGVVNPAILTIGGGD